MKPIRIYKIPVIVFSLLTLVLSSCSSTNTKTNADFYVSTTGNDEWSGTLEEPNSAKTDGPFATLDRARLAVQNLKETKEDDITVLIRSGKYYLKETVVFGLEDSAPDNHTITYAAYPDEEPIFSSGVKIDGWKELGREIPPQLPEMAKNNIWITDVPEELGLFKTLYDGDSRLPRARCQGFNPLPLKNDGNKYDPYSTMAFPEGELKNWDYIKDAELILRPIPWTMHILPLESVDEEASIAKTTIKGIYPLKVNRRLSEGNAAWIENVLEGLDSPGEWVLNTKEKRLYLWPVGDKPSDEIFAPTLTVLIKVEGSIDFDGPEDIPVKGLVFKDLNFTQAERGTINKNDTASIQHDWEIIDKDDALIRFRGSENCVVKNCKFYNSGSSAIRMDLYAQNNVVEGNEINNLGGGGIHFIGYGPGTKNVNKGNKIINNHIHHTGQIYWHAHAIVVWQSGDNLVSHNSIHHVPRKAICMSGVRPHFFHPDRAAVKFGLRECAPSIRWHEIKDSIAVAESAKELVRIHKPAVFEHMEWPEITTYLHTANNITEYNEAYRTNEILGDGSSMNVSGAGEGNVLRRNYIHDIFNEDLHGAIRTDDYQNGTLIEENVIFRTNSDGICLRHNNDAINNIIVDVGETESRENGKTCRYLWVGHNRMDGSIIEKNIYFHPGGNQMFIGRGYGPDIWKNFRLFKDGSIDKNIYFNTEAPDKPSVLTKLRSYGHDTNGAYLDPLFEDWENGDFRLKPNSPALKMGIKSIDVSEAGLTDDFPKRFLENN
ncbi:right-handed parallel beta-helix repeat-containing protein [Seonamhaeicola maritimus]|uniref:right-handed parallel beta-helix repeat-containing protein n=1 Tax=Seonamhaeicola maritimus TaxID=2591822 RepID=UPI00249513AA|nr:right-handed parallel beta-helix repeat-containing protein [Seonamhaeicola maritimus]